MSDEHESPIYFFDQADPAMAEACQRARDTFRYFWREQAWERRRIIPALGLAAIKAPFWDGDEPPVADGQPQAEQMWVGEVDFDGRDVTGVLLNQPGWVQSVSEGDPVRLPLTQVTDWMYAIDDKVYGAFTVNVMRQRMAPADREGHDDAWGLDFGDPASYRLVPWDLDSPDDEHPMSLNMAPALAEQLAENPSMVSGTDERGWTLLHDQALAGSAATVGVLLDAGADPDARTGDGRTPLDLARALGWEAVASLLLQRGR